MANDILPFCPTDTGSNLLSESDYLAATDRTIGNQPGIASAKLVNKALRQSAFMASQLGQYISNTTGTDLSDDANTAKLLAQFVATLKPYAPNFTKKTTGSGTFLLTWIFQIASGNATIGATYTNNAHTFTVVATVASAVEVRMTGTGDPAASGTLTKASGSGDATLTFYCNRKPIQLVVEAVGGGGGGGGGGSTSGSAANAGGDTTFGTTMISAGGGGAGAAGGTDGNAGPGGSGSLGTGPVGVAVSGTRGAQGGLFAEVATGSTPGLTGGNSVLGGAGGGTFGSSGTAAATNSGSGGGSGGADYQIGTPTQPGGGGGSGAYVKGYISSPLGAGYSYGVGAGGSAGTAGTNGFDGGAGAAGLLTIVELYQ